MAENGNTEGQLTPEEVKALKAELTELKGKNTNLSAMVEKFAQNQSEFDQKLAAVADAKAGNKDEPKSPDDIFKGVDLESLSQADFAKLMLQATGVMVTGALGEALKPLSEKLEQTSTHVATTSLKEQVDKAKKTHKDFDEWVPSIRDLAKDFPKASVEDLYVLARNKDPDKAMELDKKYAPPPAKSGEQQDESPYGGFFGGATPPASGERSNKTQKEAAEDAWSQVFGPGQAVSG